MSRLEYAPLLSFALFAGLFGLIFLLRHSYHWLYARRHTRFSCEIPVELMIGEKSVAGDIVILGQRGCRIVLQLSNPQVIEDIYSAHGKLFVCVADVRLKLCLIGADAAKVSCLFAQPLQEARIYSLLEGSRKQVSYSASAIPKYARPVLTQVVGGETMENSQA